MVFIGFNRTGELSRGGFSGNREVFFTSRQEDSREVHRSNTESSTSSATRDQVHGVGQEVNLGVVENGEGNPSTRCHLINVEYGVLIRFANLKEDWIQEKEVLEV